MKHNIITFSVLLIASFMLSCSSDTPIDFRIEFPTDFISEDMVLKSGDIVTQPACDPEWIPLLTENKTNVGNLLVSNNESYLEVEFIPDNSYTISEVHLWIGTDPKKVPKNRRNVPIPGKFDYKASEQSAYSFSIKLSDIYKIPEMLLEGKAIYLFAHTVFGNEISSDLFSAWSAGTSFGVKRWGTYSTYACCHPIGGGGCFPHNAYCGEPVQEINLLQNIPLLNQKIYADNGEIIGNTFLADGRIYFDFDQDWMFSGATPEIVVTGYSDPENSGTPIYMGNPDWDASEFLHYIAVSDFNYYHIELQVQFCTTDNN